MPEPDQDRAIDAWVRANLAPAVAYARSLLRDRAAAEDVVHDCFCRLLKRADVYDLPNDGTKLLFRAVTNACINLGQRAKPVVSLNGEADPLAERLLDARTASPPAAATASELSVAIDRGLAKLSVMQRAAIELRALGHTLDDIGDTLGLTATNAGVLIHRARQALKEELAAYLG
ncbi:MAG TPA: sigma-70 family RNA polymerase sigma factor [Gemmataceae bacterium]|nr:sigma-70 family RNA polymerase sigma factor [Gemmataceae bacterium]